EALEAAVRHFWARGYEAASIRDLAECMGIRGASLYNAYGGKRDLFILALDHYFTGSTRERIQRIERSHAGQNAISAFFDEIIARSVDDEQRKGCLLVNSAVELASHDSELREIIGSYIEEITAFFSRQVSLAQARGEASPSIDVIQISTHLLGVLMGIRVL